MRRFSLILVSSCELWSILFCQKYRSPTSPKRMINVVSFSCDICRWEMILQNIIEEHVMNCYQIIWFVKYLVLKLLLMLRLWLWLANLFESSCLCFTSQWDVIMVSCMCWECIYEIYVPRMWIWFVERKVTASLKSQKKWSREMPKKECFLDKAGWQI